MKSLISPSLSFLKKLFCMRDQKFMTSIQKGGEEVLKFVACLRALLFLNNRSIVHFCEWGWVQSKKWSFLVDVIIVWCLWQCFNASATVKQPSSLLSRCTFKTKSKFLIFFILQEWHQNAQSHNFIQASITVGIKN